MTSSIQFSSVEFFKHFLSAVDISGTWSWVLYIVSAQVYLIDLRGQKLQLS